MPAQDDGEGASLGGCLMWEATKGRRAGQLSVQLKLLCHRSKVEYLELLLAEFQRQLPRAHIVTIEVKLGFDKPQPDVLALWRDLGYSNQSGGQSVSRYVET